MAPRMRNLKRDNITLLGLVRLETCRWKKELKEEMVLILNRSSRYGCGTFIQRGTATEVQPISIIIELARVPKLYLIG